MITVPSATWLWQQGPKKSDHHDDHGHGSHEDNNEKEGGAEGEGEGDNEAKAEDAEKDKPRDAEESGEKSDDDGGSGEDATSKEDPRPTGEKVRNEPPNEITATENKFTSGDEGLKEGPNDGVHQKSQQMKSIDPDADEGKRDGPSDNVDKGHEGEEKGTRVTEEDKKRKVSNVCEDACDKRFLLL